MNYFSEPKVQRPFDRDGRILCDIQANLFAASPVHCDCSSAIFVRRFMNSELAAAMDEPSTFLNRPFTLEEGFERLSSEYGESAYGSECYPKENLFWMGYLYRYWAYIMGEKSKNLFKIIGARELSALYPAYHTLDPEKAIDRILEAKGLLSGEDFETRALRVLREVKARYQ